MICLYHHHFKYTTSTSYNNTWCGSLVCYHSLWIGSDLQIASIPVNSLPMRVCISLPNWFLSVSVLVTDFFFPHVKWVWAFPPKEGLYQFAKLISFPYQFLWLISFSPTSSGSVPPLLKRVCISLLDWFLFPYQLTRLISFCAHYSWHHE
jgi:hypothetical protein